MGVFNRLDERLQRRPHFDGPAYEPDYDRPRLTGQIRRVFDLMADHRWRTLQEICTMTGDPAASVSAQLRHLRKRRFGGYLVERRRRGHRSAGLWEYRVTGSEPNMNEKR
jgi:hypothetical protein